LFVLIETAFFSFSFLSFYFCLFFVLFCFVFCFFETGLLCVALAGLKLRNPPTSAFQVLELKAHATTAQHFKSGCSFQSSKSLPVCQPCVPDKT
jgi:hypothetical protein